MSSFPFFISLNQLSFLFQVSLTCVGPDNTECASIPPPATETDCMVDVTYTYVITNTGSSSMDLTDLTSTQNGVTVSLVGLLNVTSLQPGESVTVTETKTIDLCSGSSFTTDVNVIATPPSGSPCFGTDTYVFTPSTLAPATPAPVTPAPVTPSPVTSAPTSLSPTVAPVTSAPSTCEPWLETCLCNGTIKVGFNVCNPQPEDWIGIYPCLNTTNATLYNYHPSTWQYTCVDAPCTIDNLAYSGDLVYDDNLPTYVQYGPHDWPLPPGCYIAIYNRNYGLSPPPYDIVIEGQEFYV